MLPNIRHHQTAVIVMKFILLSVGRSSSVRYLCHVLIFILFRVTACTSETRIPASACKLKLRDVVREFDFFHDGDIVIGGMITWNTDSADYPYTGDLVTQIRCYELAMALQILQKLTDMPVFRCSDICRTGTRKKPGSSVHPCCYDCVPCPEGEISNTSDSENCMKCAEDEWPNEKKDRCIPRSVEFLSYSDDISSVLISISILFCLVTVLIMRVFISYLDTPIVKANNRSLSFVLLVCIMLSFLCVFLFLGRPLDITCILRVTTFGVIFSIALSSLLAKTIMVYIAFKATKPGSYWRKWIGMKFTNCMVVLLSSVQIVISVVWLCVSPPFMEKETQSFQGKIIIQCNEGAGFGLYSVLGYMGFLAAVSFVLAFMVRTLPDRFNEAKYITFSMLVFCSVWIAMIPAYLSTRGKYMVAVEIFTILMSTSALLFCIFLPKCYIILFKPDVNTQAGLLKT